jgi:hypothetical protein
MEMIDTAVYTCEAYRCYGKIAGLLGDTQEAKQFALLSEQAKEAINRDLWDSRNGLYCDCFASYRTIMAKKEQLMKHLSNSASSEHIKYIEKQLAERSLEPNREYGWLLNQNWVINTPMETGISPVDKAETALKNMHSETFIGKYGMYGRPNGWPSSMVFRVYTQIT